VLSLTGAASVPVDVTFQLSRDEHAVVTLPTAGRPKMWKVGPPPPKGERAGPRIAPAKRARIIGPAYDGDHLRQGMTPHDRARSSSIDREACA
jgi:hypothetical protein